MPYFLSKENLIADKEITITGEEAAHILLSHRVKKGERIKLQGPNEKRFLAEVVNVTKKEVTVKLLQSLPVPPESKVELVLFQAVVSEKALDFIFQKGTELGLAKIVLFNSANVAAKLSHEQFSKKEQRWNRILFEAAKQSERVRPPSLEFLPSLGQAISNLKTYSKVFFTDISGQKLLSTNYQLQPTAFVVGPEGGLTEAEVKQLQTLNNLQTISLGPILLRAETAALAIVAIIRLWSI